MTDSRLVAGSGGGRRAVGLGSGLWGPVWVVGLVALLVFTGCAGPGSDTDQETAGAEDESADGASNASGGGLIDVEGGYTQQEQMAELETVVEVMREHFGEEVATIGDEPWTAERHNADISARPRGDDVYRHRVGFNVPADADLEETYAAAEEIAEELGLSENLNNSHGINQDDKIFYGAGRDEGRSFVIASTTDGNAYRASYNTRHSDHESIHEAYERIIDDFREDFRDQYRSDDPD